MQLVRYDWDCHHRVVVNSAGQRVGAEQVGDPENEVVDATPPYPCPQCSDPPGDLTHLGTVPPRDGKIMLWTNPLKLFNEGESTGAEEATACDPSTDEPDNADADAESIGGGVGVLETAVQRESESADELIGDIAPIDTDELANYDPPQAGPHQQARLDAMFSAQERAVDDPSHQQQSDVQQFDIQQRDISQEQNNSQDLVKYRNGGDTQQPSYADELGTSHHIPSTGLGSSFSQLSVSAPQFIPTPPYGSTYQNESRALVRYEGAGMAGATMNQPPAPPTAPRVLKQIYHRVGKPCPESHAQCHWHYSDWCHNVFDMCEPAFKAMKAAATNHNDYKGAVDGWNQIHAKCVRRDNPDRCELHQRIYRGNYGRDIGR